VTVSAGVRWTGRVGIGGIVGEERMLAGAVLERGDPVPEGSGLVDVSEVRCHCFSYCCVRDGFGGQWCDDSEVRQMEWKMMVYMPL